MIHIFKFESWKWLQNADYVGYVNSQLLLGSNGLWAADSALSTLPLPLILFSGPLRSIFRSRSRSAHMLMPTAEKLRNAPYNL